MASKVQVQTLDPIQAEELLWSYARKVSEAVRERLEAENIHVYDWDIQVEISRSKARVTWRFLINVSEFFEPENRCVYYEDAYYACQASVLEWAKEQGVDVEEVEDEAAKKVEECVKEYVEEELAEMKELPFRYEFSDFVEIEAKMKIVEEENVDRVCVYDVLEVTIVHEVVLSVADDVLKNENVFNYNVDHIASEIEKQYDVIKVLAGVA